MQYAISMQRRSSNHTTNCVKGEEKIPRYRPPQALGTVQLRRQWLPPRQFYRTVTNEDDSVVMGISEDDAHELESPMRLY